MAKIEHEPPRTNELEYGVRKNYITLNNKPNTDNYTTIPKEGLEGWYRTFSMGNSASIKRFGGRRRTRTIRKKIHRV